MSTDEKEEIIKIEENIFIPLNDGVELSARIWMPRDVAEKPVPAVLEFLPYRKRDKTTFRDEITHQHLALNGYVGVRVDMRGCGDSTGLPQDEYVEQEQVDAVQVIDWISMQPWCSGSVGMMGISWGGFNSLQVAACQPPALKAVISISFSDDRFQDDIHYKGGVMLMGNTSWAAYMDAITSLPPDPVFSPSWKEKWKRRLDAIPTFAKTWMSHPTKDSYWKHASVCQDYSRIKAATFLICGYADGYTNTVERTLDNLNCPTRAIIGPWVHLYPHIAVPEPRWGFCTEAVKWFDKHLKGLELPEPPKLVTYVQENVPVPFPEHVEGKWIQNPSSIMKRFVVGANRKLRVMQEGGGGSGEGVLSFNTDTCWHQLAAFFFVGRNGLPMEQSPDDRRSVLFDTDDFTEETEFLGRPLVTLTVSSDKIYANIFLRLCVVNSSNQSRLISYTAYNLNLDESGEHMERLKSGVSKSVVVKFDYIGEKISVGSKLRLAIAGNYFPTFIPNAEPVNFQIDINRLQLEMPTLVSSEPYTNVIPAITKCKPLEYVMRKASSYAESASINETGCHEFQTKSYSGEKEFLAHSLVTEWRTEENTSMNPADPASATQNVTHELSWSREPDIRAKIKCEFNLTMDKDRFYIERHKIIKVNDDEFFSQHTKTNVMRNQPWVDGINQ